MKPSGNLSVWPQCGHYTTTVIVIWATRVNEEAQEQPQGTDLQSIPCLHCALIMISFLVMLPSPLIFQIMYVYVLPPTAVHTVHALHVWQQCDSSDEICSCASYFLIGDHAALPLIQLQKEIAKATKLQRTLGENTIQAPGGDSRMFPWGKPYSTCAE